MLCIKYVLYSLYQTMVEQQRDSLRIFIIIIPNNHNNNNNNVSTI